MVKVMLEYFKAHRDTEILLLFQLLRALCGRFVADLQFLRDFLENEVGQLCHLSFYDFRLTKVSQ